MRWLLRIGVLASLFCTPMVLAGPGYVGVGVGYSKVEARIDVFTLDASDTGYKVFGGYRFSEHFGIEGGYVDLGKQEGSDAGATLSTEIQGWDLLGVGVAPVGDRFEIWGKAGLILADTTLFNGGGVTPVETSETTVDLVVGVGGTFKLERVAFRAEIEYFSIDNTEGAILGSVGIEFRF